MLTITFSLWQLAGTAGLLVVSLVAVCWLAAGWIGQRMTKVLDSYANSYASRQADIDARIRNLERLIEEQAKLTRATEIEKAKVAARAQLNAERWKFKRDAYVELMAAANDAMYYFKLIDADNIPLDLRIGNFNESMTRLIKGLSVAGMAASDNLAASVDRHGQLLKGIDGKMASAERMEAMCEILSRMTMDLQKTGRVELWEQHNDV